uniref:Ketosynthase family 3 (KS3) domain-containing protein n=1 Tax=Alexandrium monilatum TaxID=311494 RepID=A0A7S4W4M9_9DINO
MPDSGEEPAEATEKDQWTELDFRLVEIVNQEPVDPLPEVLEANPGAQKLEVDGKRGQVLSWIEEQGKYLVETFDGDQAPVPWDHLREYEPPDPEAGGFHVAMPRSDFRAEYFPMELAEALESKLYCVIQATSTPGARKSAARNLVEREEKWTRIMPDMEPAYMGQNPGGKKILWLSHSDEHDDDPSVEHGLAEADRVLTTLSGFLGPICPSLGFEAIHRTNAFVHARCSSRGEEEELLEAFWEPTYKITAEEMQAHLSFKYRRKLCMMYFVNGSGGTLTLHPSYKGWDDIKISCQENQIVVFRHDICDYTFWPEGKQFCVQAWILRAPQAGEVGISSADKTDRYNEAIDMIPDGPGYGTSPESVDCMSLACRYPGVVWAPEDYWNLLSVGCDGGLKIPNSRWDHDLYYDPNPETMTPGKAYAQHFGMLEIDALANFESTFFGIPEDEAECIDPPCRVMLEVGYDCLYRGGWTRKKLEGSTIGTCYGTAESEFAGMLMAGFWGAKKKARIGLMPAMTCSRLQYCFSIKGPTSTAETACSSALSATCVMHHWMRPQMPDQFQKRTMCAQVPYGLAGGLNAAFNANTMIGFCGAHMLSIQGRCFTFDQGGDGFLRAEGIGAMFYKTSHGEDHARLSMLVASQMNQDGRSASLTAPHGPSQQECIRHSLREANIPPLKIQMQELHGTGTALGDPIEVGALRATMMMFQGDVREHPLVKTSSKSNIGHLEGGAGIAGLLKCILMLMAGTCPPNAHCRQLNPHLAVAGFPCFFDTEGIDTHLNSALTGVSSFGFGGTNGRCDIWGQARFGVNKSGELNLEELDQIAAVCPVTLGPIDSITGEPMGRPSGERRRRRADVLRDEFAPYDISRYAYTGGFRYRMAELPEEEEGGGEEDLPADVSPYICGSWSGFTQMEEMESQGGGWYLATIVLGESRCETFDICLNKERSLAIYPAIGRAGPRIWIQGPDDQGEGRRWAIDGRDMEVSAGAVYQVHFKWSTERMEIHWEEVSESSAAMALSFEHTYYIAGSFSRWKCVALTAGAEEGAWEGSLRIGSQGREEFQLLRDKDWQQAIYPAKPKTARAGVPARGPDDLGKGKHFVVRGSPGETVGVELSIADAKVVVRVVPERGEATEWQSSEGWERHAYSAVGSFNGGVPIPMSMDLMRPGVFRCRAKVGDIFYPEYAGFLELFQVAVDDDLQHTLYPEANLSTSGEVIVRGPDDYGAEKNFLVRSITPYKAFDIVLDLTAEDRRKIVTWAWVQDELEDGA